MISRPRIGLLSAIVVAVVAFFVATGSAFAAGTIEGEVVDSVSHEGVQSVVVCAYDFTSLEEVECANTDGDGEYALAGLPNGGYLVEFWAPFLNYAPQFYNGVVSFEDADEVVVSNATVAGIDAEMEEGGKVQGHVTDSVSGFGIRDIEVCAISSVIAGWCEFTDNAGDYSVGGLATGSYRVLFFDGLGEYESLFYNQQPSSEAADAVDVVAPDATTGIDARLSKPSSGVVTHPATPVAPPPVVIHKVHPKFKCHKGFKKVKRHGRKICVKKHKKKKKHHS